MLISQNLLWSVERHGEAPARSCMARHRASRCFKDCGRLNKLNFSLPQYVVAEGHQLQPPLEKTKLKSANFLYILVLTMQHLPHKSSRRGSEPGKNQRGARRGAQQDKNQWQQVTGCCLGAFLGQFHSCAFKQRPFPSAQEIS